MGAETIVRKANAFGGENVKHTLKSKILERRQNLGLGNVTIDFSPKQSYPMTEEEKEKDRRRKQSNRRSAQRCRQKQRYEYEINEKLLAQLNEDRKQLLCKVKETEEEKNRVLFALKNILPDSYICEALKVIDYHELNKSSSKTREQPEEIRNEMQAIDAFITDESIFDEKYIFGDDSLEVEILQASEEDRSIVVNIDDVEIDNGYSILQTLFMQ